jgi:hypothetical protein
MHRAGEVCSVSSAGTALQAACHLALTHTAAGMVVQGDGSPGSPGFRRGGQGVQEYGMQALVEVSCPPWLPIKHRHPASCRCCIDAAVIDKLRKCECVRLHLL